MNINKWGTKHWFKQKLELQGTNEPVAYFGHKNSGYQRYRHMKLLEFIQGFIKSHNLDNPSNLLDIGCGTGDLTAMLYTGLNVKASGVDFVEPAISIAKKNYPWINFSVGELPQLGFPDGTFDCIVASEVIYYLNQNDRETTITEIARVLKKNGLFIMSSVLGNNYLTEQTASILLSNKFSIEKTNYLYFKTYHKLISPIVYCHNAYYVVKSNSEVNGLPLFLKKYPWVYKNVLSLAFFKVIFHITSPILRSSKLVSYVESKSSVNYKSQDITNITLISLKK
jgi:ubiquinone/menaquinone biosynthesis C-methylase UbiE